MSRRKVVSRPTSTRTTAYPIRTSAPCQASSSSARPELHVEARAGDRLPRRPGQELAQRLGGVELGEQEPQERLDELRERQQDDDRRHLVGQHRAEAHADERPEGQGHHRQRDGALDLGIAQERRLAHDRQGGRTAQHGPEHAGHRDGQRERHHRHQLGPEHQAAPGLRQQGRGDGAVAELPGDAERPEDRGEDVAQGQAEGVHRHRDCPLVEDGLPEAARTTPGGARLLSRSHSQHQGERHDHAHHDHVAEHGRGRQPPRPGAGHLAKLGAKRGGHRAIPGCGLGRAAGGCEPAGSAVSWRNNDSRLVPAGASSCSGRLRAKAAWPTRGQCWS